MVVQALRINTLSKLTFSDAQRFKHALLKDVFPGVPMKDMESPDLAERCAGSLGVNEGQLRTGGLWIFRSSIWFV